MNGQPYFWMGLLCAWGLLLAGCHPKVTSSALEKAFQPAAVERGKPAAAPTAPRQPDEVQKVMQSAVTALKNNEYEDALISLQLLRAHPSLNSDQLIAVQDTMANLQTELAKRADRGDVRAQRALGALRNVQRHR